MRILASNPDTIGDVVLRQPLYDALLKAGHDLTLIVRPLLAPVMDCIAPGARILTCAANVYDPRLTVESPELDEIATAAAEAEPDLLLIAPYQWTVLEERLSVCMPNVRCIAMSGKRFVDAGHGPTPGPGLRVTKTVQVAEEAPEVRKNELLAAAVLDRAVSLPDPVIKPRPEHTLAAGAALARLGLEADGYWVACIGDTEHTTIRNWDHQHWSDTLAAWARKHDRRFLVIGHSSEMPAAEAIVNGMGAQSGHASLWSGRGDGDLDVLIGLIAASRGYVGRDTGPMHLSAAMGKPTLAVFGGGTWPRFLPAVDPSVSIAVGVPCVGCGWVCHLARSYCIKEVPPGAVLAAADELEGGGVQGRQTRLIKPDGVLLSRIGREGGENARQRLVELSVMRRQHMEQSDSLAAVLERALKQAGRAEAAAEELGAAKAEFERREAILKNRLAATENTHRIREADLTRRLAEAETVARAAPPAELQAAHRREAELTERLTRAQADLARAQSELLQAKAEAADAKLKTSKAERDQGTLLTLTRQQESEVVVLRGRLRELMASRWRRYGQRVGLCMTMPWEKESLNGKH